MPNIQCIQKRINFKLTKRNVLQIRMLYNEHIIRSHCLWSFVIKEQMRESKIPPQKSLLYSKMNSFLPEKLDSYVTQKENQFWLYYLTDGKRSTYYTGHESLRQQILAVLFDDEEDFPILYQLNLIHKREVN